MNEEVRERLKSWGDSLGTCSQCNKKGVLVLYYRGGVWCFDCREKDVAKLPPLPPPVERRDEIAVVYGDHTYRFDSKKAARSGMRALLKAKRLPLEVTIQIDGARERRASKRKKREGIMSTTLTASQLDTAAKNMENGSTLSAEAEKLGLKRGKPLRDALKERIGDAAYNALVPRGRGKGEGKGKGKAKKAKKAAKAKPKAKKAAKAKPKAKKRSTPKKKAAAEPAPASAE